MADRYNGEIGPSYNGNDHIVKKITKNGEEYYYCKCKGCKLGISADRVKSKEQAEETLNELDCPPSDSDRAEHTIEKKGFVIPQRHI